MKSLLSRLVALVKREPARVATLVLVAAVVTVAEVTGQPVAAVVAQGVGIIGALEGVRASVMPVVKLALGDEKAAEIEATASAGEAKADATAVEINAGAQTVEDVVAATRKQVLGGVGKVK